MMNSKGAFSYDAASADKQALLAVVLIVTALAGLVLLWPSDRMRDLSQQTGAELSEHDAVRVQTLLRAF